MPGRTRVDISGFELALDRWYEAQTHMWVQSVGGGRYRVGMDPLGVETCGTIAHLSISGVDGEVQAGHVFGQLEAAKFVGPLVSPVSGTLHQVNESAVADPGVVQRDPYGAGWLIEVEVSEPATLEAGLLREADVIVAWFSDRIRRYRSEGVLAE